MKFAAFAIAILVAALSASAADPVKVSCFSTILTEIAQEVGGSHVKVAGLVKPDTDPHEYQPTPADLKEVGASELIFTSGKHLGSYIDKLQEATGGHAKLVKVGDKIPSLKTKGIDGAASEDPHWWHSVENVKKATAIVRDELIEVDPADKDTFTTNAAKYSKGLDDLQSWAKRKVAELPRDKRKLVTSHDALQYFAHDYGFTILAIEGVNTETEPSNRAVAKLIDEVKAQGVKAIFLESTLNPKVVTEITRETGAKIGGTLYADGLGTGETGTYSGMMKHNVSTIVDALK